MTQPQPNQPPVAGYDTQQLEEAAAPLEAATTVALIAVAAAAAARLVTAPAASAPSGAVGAAFITLDDLAAITTMWVQHTDRELMPILRSVFHDTAQHVHNQISKLFADLVELPPGMTEIPSEVATIPNVHAEDLMSQARNRLVGIGDLLWANARQQMAEGMRQGESIPQLAERVRQAAGVTEPRGTMIARTEVISTSNGAAIAQARTAGVEMVKEWIHTHDDRTRATHKNFSPANPLGIVHPRVPLSEPFIVGGFPLDFPGDPTGPPGQVINCRCSVGFHLDLGLLTAAARAPKLAGEALAEFNKLHPRGHGGKFGSGTGPASAVKKAVKAVAAPRAVDVAKAKQRLANAEKMFGTDRSKWKKRDRDLAEKLDQFIQQSESAPPSEVKAPTKRAPSKASAAPLMKPKQAEAMQRRILENDPWTDQQRESITYYTGTDDANYRQMNELLYNPHQMRLDPQQDEIDKQHIQNLHAAMRPTDTPVTVFRGASKRGLGLDTFNEEDFPDLIGRKFQNRGFSSTSIDQKTALGVDSGSYEAILQIEVPAGTPAAYVDIDDLTDLHEQEMILDAGTTLEYVSIGKTYNGRPIIHARVVPA